MINHKMVKADFICALIIIIFSLMIIYQCFIMPRYEEWGLYATPSMPPLIFSIILLIMGIILLIRSIKNEGHKISVNKDKIAYFIRLISTRRFIIALTLVIIYFFLLNEFHFALISTAYLFLNMLIFSKIDWWKNLIISIGVSVSIWILFEIVFLVPLP